MFKNSVVAAVALLALADQTQASFSYTGGTYSQSFDTLPNAGTGASLGNSPIGWTDDNASPGAGNFSIVGWYLFHPANLVAGEGGFNGRQRMRSGPGSGNAGSFWSYGTGTSTDRAISSLASNTTAPLPPASSGTQHIGLRLTNNTGGTLDSFTVTYDGEQWRDGGAATPNAQQLTFAWSLTAASVQDNPAFTDLVPALNFVSPVFANAGAGAAVDGNVAGRVNNITATITGLSWLNGTDLWLRWTDLNDAGNDHGLGIDDVDFSASATPRPIPEPGSIAVWGCLAALGMATAKYFRQ